MGAWSQLAGLLRLAANNQQRPNRAACGRAGLLNARGATWRRSRPPHSTSGAGTAATLYRRNRYYDAQTGRFTQEDPIGLAGGMNLYGFADGDPVNFSDPFGLTAQIGCPPLCDNFDPDRDTFIRTDNPKVAAAAGAVMIAASGGALAVGGLASSAAASGGAAVGTNATLVAEARGALGTITGFTRHGINQVITRGVRPTDILQAVRNSDAVRLVDEAGRVSFRYVGDKATVVLNTVGKVITAW